jgi:hypothetical protein
MDGIWIGVENEIVHRIIRTEIKNLKVRLIVFLSAHSLFHSPVLVYTRKKRSFQDFMLLLFLSQKKELPTNCEVHALEATRRGLI